MNSLDFLKQAQLADNLGYFRLADQLYKKASRTVTASAFDKALLEALEKAGIKAGEKASLEAVQTALLSALRKAMTKGEAAELRLLLKESGVAEETIEKIVKNTVDEKAPTLEFLKSVAIDLEANLNGSKSIFNRMKPLNRTMSYVKEKISSLMKNPGAMKKLIKYGIVASVGALGWNFVNANGDPVSDEEVHAALTGDDPYSNMFEDRMKAGQQQGQNDAAQKFVDENKSKYTSQRAFYDAALGAGDKNFANDVIAIVKKDTPELPREPTKSGEKESSSYLNKTPYSGS